MTDGNRPREGYGTLIVLTLALIAVAVSCVVFFDAENQFGALDDRLEQLAARLDALQQERRPWVSAELAIASDLTFDAAGGHLRLAYQLQNGGQTPAFNVTAVPIVIAASATVSPADPQRVLEQRCVPVEAAVAAAIRSPAMPWQNALFPGQQLRREEAAAIRGSRAVGGNTPPTLVISCIHYHSGGHGVVHHETGRVYYLKRHRDGTQSWTDVDLSRRENIPAAELSLSPASDGTYAD